MSGKTERRTKNKGVATVHIGQGVQEYIEKRAAQSPTFAAGLDRARRAIARARVAVKAREAKGLSQQELARQASVSPATVRDLEQFSERITTEQLGKIASVLGVDFEVFKEQSALGT